MSIVISGGKSARAQTAASLALHVAIATVPACSSTPGQGRSAAVPVAAPHATVMAMAQSTHAPPAVAESPTPSPQPTVDYPSLEAARDAVERVVRSAVAPGHPAIAMRRDTVTFGYWYANARASGWDFRVEVRDTSECPNEAIQHALESAGWAPSYIYQADGPDGGDLGFVTRRFLCLVQAQWDGGDDSDTTYVPLPGCTVTVTLVPRRSDDVPR